MSGRNIGRSLSSKLQTSNKKTKNNDETRPQFSVTKSIPASLLSQDSRSQIHINNSGHTHTDFRTRIFLSDTRNQRVSPHQIENEMTNSHNNACNNDFWVRTYHKDFIAVVPNPINGDDGNIDCPFHLVNNYFQAAYTTEDHMVAKANLTKLLTTIYEFENEEYYAFTTIIASGLADRADKTSFHIKGMSLPWENKISLNQDKVHQNAGLLEDEENISEARARLMLLMDIIFRKMNAKRFLIDNDFSNIFRLVHCETKGQRNKSSFIYVIFSSLLQLCLALFCMTEVLTEVEQVNQEEKAMHVQYDLYILASLGSLFGFLSQLREFRNAHKVYHFYGKLGPLQMIDFVVNVITPLLIIFVGFWLVSSQDNFVDAVIMTTALLFIPEIDDQLPGLLGFDRDALIEMYLVREAKIAYNHDILQNTNDGIQNDNPDLLRICSIKNTTQNSQRKLSKMGMEFSDYFITNPEQGADASPGTYQPSGNGLKIFSADYDPTGGHEISPAKVISEDCLIETIEWRHAQEDNDGPILWLKLVKMNGDVILKDYISQHNLHGIGKSASIGETHRLQGFYMITDLVMETFSITTLRLCGSKRASDFLDAIKYYSLWDITREAKSSLKLASQITVSDNRGERFYHAMV